MLCFRIEDVESSKGILRLYQLTDEELPVIEKSELDNYIAEKIRKQVNGTNNRSILSYSKSLGVCLLKYNKYCDNELHICYLEPSIYNTVSYYCNTNLWVYNNYYSLASSLNGNYIFHDTGKIKLCNFVIDISNNDELNKYLLKFTDENKGLKRVASPQKDCEIVMMQSYNDIVIKEYIDSIYILYGLQIKYKFLNDKIVLGIVHEIECLHQCYFSNCIGERNAIIKIIQYLYSCTNVEEIMSKMIFRDITSRECVSTFYSPILQLLDIQKYSFKEANDLIKSYPYNIVTDIFLTYCNYFIENKI